MKICKVEGCSKKQRAGGYCPMHYARFKRHGNPMFVKQTQERHGMINTPEYKTWEAMKERCYREKHKHYKHYGGREITVCDNWRNSFLAFFKDMGKRPFLKAQIDRINNDGNYTPENCHWTTCLENNRNRAYNKLTMQKANNIRKRYEDGGILIKELAVIYGVAIVTISRVINQKRWRNIV